MTVGRNTMIFHGAWLSVERAAWEATEPVIRIGASVGIRPYCTISAAESVVIEDYVVLSAFSTVVDSDHTFVRGEPSVLRGPLATSPIRIGRGTWIGERCAILRGADIGEPLHHRREQRRPRPHPGQLDRRRGAGPGWWARPSPNRSF